jgi:hypothetical protein
LKEKNQSSRLKKKSKLPPRENHLPKQHPKVERRQLSKRLLTIGQELSSLIRISVRKANF